ncbi:2-oxo-4-hydroxy-4-carboxy-5-ureidoimidazoline decarboxylase [Ktedonospora formicarum]|uniref:2-oxo-4-hydroxy-4-carboxy-5-ureidoimidazoline decarboxylase n=1 Tax=Ktedonospora formicarum TaxID=2778364 RepID=A0A8J3HZC0_9CHLR|nr:2-oxo-4-hydroxy-4-carboxy-5-ureidoimidazoline decarboxylase [Ktedonospora formicarum]GHO46514.1 2-oxo-4-hydroxy-4-carboxy-5-ureidoimidazoline decarboxylase [Ktedonospora formicarum]
MASLTITLQDINTYEKETFISALANLFEGPPWIVTNAYPTRPFASLDQLHQVLCSIMYAAPLDQQVALLRAHPDLVGRAALIGSLSPASKGEQAAAGLDQLTGEEIATFQHNNKLYRERFGFPFVICARENKKESILDGFDKRLNHTFEQEVTLALTEVAKICSLRLRDLVVDDSL